MRQHKFFGLLMILASAFLFVQCTSELPEPIQGPPGVDGQNGVDGQDGVSGTASCVSCHNNTLRGEIAADFEISQHNDGGYPASRVGCAQCHDSDGFIDFIETGAAPGPYDGITINCSTCHDMHKTFDFENDGPDYALRLTEGTNLVIAPSIKLDFEGSSNACISCHQPRVPNNGIPALNADGIYIIDGNTRFGGHYGMQSTTFEGVLGAELAGPLPYPQPGNVGAEAGNGHRALSCTECHMGESTAEDRGGHTFRPIEDNCITCHGIRPAMQDYETLRTTLRDLLRTVEGVAWEKDAEGNYIITDTPVIGIIQADSEYRTNPGVFSDVAAMAAWNYLKVYHDQSKGIHNPDYTRALLTNSIDALQNED